LGGELPYFGRQNKSKETCNPPKGPFTVSACRAIKKKGRQRKKKKTKAHNRFLKRTSIGPKKRKDRPPIGKKKGVKSSPQPTKENRNCPFHILDRKEGDPVREGRSSGRQEEGKDFGLGRKGEKKGGKPLFFFLKRKTFPGLR